MNDKSEDVPITYDCSVCSDTYHISKKKPFILTPCGHLICNSCMKCLKKMNETVCPTCKTSIININESLPSDIIQKTSMNMDQVKVNYAKMRHMKNEFFKNFSKERNEKTKYFEKLQLQVRDKTQEAVKKLYENEHNILRQIKNLESKFDKVIVNFTALDDALEKNIKAWEPELTESNDATMLNKKIIKETEYLEGIVKTFEKVGLIIV